MKLKDILAGLAVTYAVFTPVTALAQETAPEIREVSRNENKLHSIAYLRLENYEAVTIDAEVTTTLNFSNLSLSIEDDVLKLCGTLFKHESCKSPAPLDFVIKKQGDDVDIWTYDSVRNIYNKVSEFSQDAISFQQVQDKRMNPLSIIRLKKKRTALEQILGNIDPKMYLDDMEKIIKAEKYPAAGLFLWHHLDHWALNPKKSDEENFKFYKHNLNQNLTQAVCCGQNSARLNSEIQRFFGDYRFKADFYTIEETGHILHFHHFLSGMHNAYFIRRPDKKTEFQGWIPICEAKTKESEWYELKIVYDEKGAVASNQIIHHLGKKKEVLDKPVSDPGASAIYKLGVPILNRCVKTLE